jgi:hypothetical protein
MARSQGWWPVTVFYPFGHPTVYAYSTDLEVRRFLSLVFDEVKNGFPRMRNVLLAGQVSGGDHIITSLLFTSV